MLSKHQSARGDGGRPRTALLDVDPIHRIRGRRGAEAAFALEQYVNDRPYAASSLPPTGPTAGPSTASRACSWPPPARLRGHRAVDCDHLWHMETLARLCAHDDLLLATEHRVVEFADADACAAATAWWEALTASGGEGMVVKPVDFVHECVFGVLALESEPVDPRL